MNRLNRDRLAQVARTHSLSLLLSALVPLALLVCLLAALGTAHGAPDTVAVTTTNDVVDGTTDSIAELNLDPGADGEISLREAVIAANNTPGMDEIILPSGTYTLTIEGSGEDLAATGDLDITDDLTITGAGASTTIIDAGGMTTDPDRVFDFGPGTSADENIAISDVTITNGDAGDSHDGGGIWHRSVYGTVALTRCTITNNSAWDGGGIAAYGELNLAYCTVSGNTAIGDGGGLRASAPATIADSTFTGNSADDEGGGIWSIVDATLTDTTINGNSAALDGGGIWFMYGSLALTNTTISENTAEENGGGVYSTGELQIADSTVYDNSAWRGSGIYQTGGNATLTYTLVAGNIAGVQGGGIYVQDGELAMSHCEVNNNEAGTRGGGIAIMDGGSADITGSTISQNSSSSGGGLYVGAEVRDASLVLGSSVVSDNDSLLGGGICVFSSKSTANATGSEISSNSGLMGGGLYNAGTSMLTDCLVTDNSSYADGGGIYNYWNLVDLSNTAVSGNSAASNGGGICNAEEATLILGRCTISENSSDSGDGGGIFNDGSADLSNSTISGNSANTGGAVSSAGAAALTNVTVAWNSTTSGGALDTRDGGDITLKNTIVANPPHGADCSSNVVTRGYNIDTDGTCNLTYFGDLPSTDPKIGPLQDNGGPTLTHALLETSPAIDAGDNSVGLTTDQRGFPRPVAGGYGCLRTTDIGAYEDQGFVDLLVTKSGNPNPVMAGEELIYDLTAQNLGDQPATGVVLSDTLPAELEYLSDTDSCSVVGTSPGGGQILECQIGALQGCTSRPFQIKTRVKADAVAWEPTGAISISNSASVTGDQEDYNIINNLTLVAVLVQDEADLRVLKTSTPDDAVGIGQVFTYTIYVDNLGPSYAREVRFTDEILASGELTILESVGDPDRDDTCVMSNTTVDCQLNEPLEPQGYGAGDGRWTVLLRVQADERQDVDNVVTVYTEEGGTPDPDTSNNVAEDAIHVGPADLEIVKDVSPGPYYAGNQITYTLTVTNHGPDPAVNVVLEDLLPEVVTVVEMIPSQGSCTSGLPGNPDAPLTCSLGELVPEAEATVEVHVLIDEGYDGYLENDSLVYSEVYDPDNGNNRDTVIIQMDTYADLSISSRARGEFAVDAVAGIPGIYYIELDDEVTAGRQIWYEITVENKGASDALQVAVEDFSHPYPFFEFQYAEGGTCQPMGNPGLLLCELGTLPAGTAKTFRIYMLVDSSAPDYISYLHESSVTSLTHDPYTGDNFVSEEITVYNQADLSLSKTSEAPKVYEGDQIRYDVTVTNNGPSAARAVSVIDTLPLEVEFEFATEEPVLCEQVLGGPMTCTWEWEEPLLPAESRAFSIYARVLKETPPGTITNQARVETEVESLLSYNDEDSALNLVLTPECADLQVSKTALGEVQVDGQEGLTFDIALPGTPFPEDPNYTTSPAQVTAGRRISYTVTISNEGPSAAENVQVTDLLPPGVTLYPGSLTLSQGTCSTGTPGVPPQELLCGLGTLAPDAIATITFQVVVDPAQPTWTVLENDVSVTSDNPEPYNEDNQAHTLTIVNNRSDLGISSQATGEVAFDMVGGVQGIFYVEFDDQVTAGRQIRYEITVQNKGASDALDVVVDDLSWIYTFFTFVQADGASCHPDIDNPDGRPGHLLCELGTIPAGSQKTVNIYMLVDPRAPDYIGYWHESSTTSNAPDPFPDDNFVHEEITVDNKADLSIRKTSEPWRVYAGEQIRYDVSVVNNGPSFARTVSVVDTLPEGLDFEMSTEPLVCVLNGSLECTWDFDEGLMPGETVEFSFYARVAPDTLPGTISNQARVETDIQNLLSYNDSDTAANSVEGKADLRIEKYGKPDGTVRAGEELTYTVIVDNLGPSYAHDVMLRDQFSSDGHFEVVTWGTNLDAVCAWQGEMEDGFWTGQLSIWCPLSDTLDLLSDPPFRGSWILTFVFRAYEPQSINNLARVVSSDFDPDPSNNEATAEHDITAVADLEITKTAWGEVPVGCGGALDLWENEVAAGRTLTYTLTVTNHGPSTAENVVVRDQPLPSLVEIQEITPSQGNCDEGYLGAPDYLLTCNLGTLSPDQSETVTIVASVPSSVLDGTELVNVARAYSDMFDGNNGNDVFTNETVVTTWSDLEVLKTQVPEIALPGWGVTYTITVTNLGPSDVEGVFISDTVPVEVLNPTWTCCASDDGECDIPCEPPICPEEPCPWPDIGLYAQADLPAGEWAIYTVSGTLDWWPCGPFTNTVEIDAPNGILDPERDTDPCPENNVAFDVNDPVCHFDPLVLKAFPGPDSTP